MSRPLAHDTVGSFVDFAASSPTSLREPIRAEIAKSPDDERIDRALCDELARARTADHSRSLIVVSILGERRTEVAADCLRRLVALPLPERGTVVEGENQERVALETLQEKALVGLAYRQTKKDEEELRRIAAEHPSPLVRAAASELLDGSTPSGDVRPW